MFLGHIFPIAARHVVELFLWIDALAYADGFEVGAPELLEDFVVLAQQFFVELPVVEVEGLGGVFGEGDTHSLALSLCIAAPPLSSRRKTVIVAILPLGIIDEPRLVAEAVLKMVDDERQHVVIGRDNGEVGAVFRLLKAYELFHAQLLLHHAARCIGHE